MKLTDKPINIQFGGGCPICKSDNTLTTGSIFKRIVECNACGSKFSSRFGLVSPKYKLIEGRSEHVGKELELGDWKKVRNGELDKIAIEKRDKQIRESKGTEKILSYFFGIALIVILSVIIVYSISLDYSTLEKTAKSLISIGVMLLILSFIIFGISIGLNRFVKK